MEFIYTAWFRNTAIDEKSQDYEWPACIIIEAETHDDALAWGEYLSEKFSGCSNQEIFIRSQCEMLREIGRIDFDCIPRVAYGHEATDDEIGW